MNPLTGRFAVRMGIGRYCLAQAPLGGGWSPRIGEEVRGGLYRNGPAEVRSTGGPHDIEVINWECNIKDVQKELQAR
ncbi:MAG: hypothetical protein ABIN08_17110 [Caldimonas sp.]